MHYTIIYFFLFLFSFSLIHSSFTGLSNPGSDCPIITLHGKPYIEETLFNLTFRVSPYAFFQVNTPVAEVLYKNIGDWLSLRSNTLLLDVCCGTGTIGLCLANRVKHVCIVELPFSSSYHYSHSHSHSSTFPMKIADFFKKKHFYLIYS